jgi:Flp pilus assembly protein TadD
LSPT